MENQVISVDSIFRNHYYDTSSSQFTYYLANRLKNINYIRLSSIELPEYIPNYTTVKQNITFEVLVEDSGSYVGETITITAGRYQSISALVNEINTQISASDLSSTYGLDLTASVTTTNGVEYFTITDSSGTEFTLNFSTENHPYRYSSGGSNLQTASLNGVSITDASISNYTSNSIISNNGGTEYPTRSNYNVLNPPLGYYLGFRNKAYTGASSYTSNAPIVLNPEKYLYVKINDYGKLMTNHGDNQYMGKVILQNSNARNFDDESNLVSKQWIFPHAVDVSKLKISLHDAYGALVDLNGLDYSLTIEFGVITSSDLYKKTRQAMP